MSKKSSTFALAFGKLPQGGLIKNENYISLPKLLFIIEIKPNL